MPDAEVEDLQTDYEGGLIEWDVLAGHWYALWYYDIDGQIQYWTPPFPGAPRRLAGVDYWFSNPAAQDPQWVADIGLELPPALVPGTLTNTWLGDQRYEEHEIGFYPSLRPGVNVVWAAGVDMTKTSLRPECSTITRLEALDSGWIYPTLKVARDQFTGSYEEYLKAIQPYSWRPPIPVDSGRGLVWSEEHGAAFHRSTIQTPYGWYTFDIELMEVRPVDTAPDSWDTINLWGDQVQYSAAYGRRYYYANLGPSALAAGHRAMARRSTLGWRYCASGSLPTLPGQHAHLSYYFEPVRPALTGDFRVHADYLRVTGRSHREAVH